MSLTVQRALVIITGKLMVLVHSPCHGVNINHWMERWKHLRGYCFLTILRSLALLCCAWNLCSIFCGQSSCCVVTVLCCCLLRNTLRLYFLCYNFFVTFSIWIWQLIALVWYWCNVLVIKYFCAMLETLVNIHLKKMLNY